MIEQNYRVVESCSNLNGLNFSDHLFVGFHEHAESFEELLLVQKILRVVFVLFFVDEAADLLFRIRFIATVSKARGSRRAFLRLDEEICELVAEERVVGRRVA